MKTELLSLCAGTLLLSLASTPAAGFSTNTVRHSCCLAASAPESKPSDKSLYQLDSTWTDDEGRMIQLSSLKGRPQIVLMFFTHCQYACPTLVFQLQQLQAALPETVRTNISFTLVSFDTERDTPAALKVYRAQQGLPRESWTLLHGDSDGVAELAALLDVRFKKDASGQYMHSNVITLLNAEGEIVYQQTGLKTDNQEFIRRIEQLTKP